MKLVFWWHYLNQGSEMTKRCKSLFAAFFFCQKSALLVQITKRTLQQYRDDGVILFVALPGKMLYRESD
jgi:hypothetical protein